MEKEEGIVKIPSHHSVDETVDKLKATLEAKEGMIFLPWSTTAAKPKKWG